MNANTRRTDLPSSVARKLNAIRVRDITFTLFRGVFLSATVLLAAVLAAMLIDLVAGWFDTRIRYAVTIVALAIALGGFVYFCIRPLARKRSLVGTARELEQALPQLEERWSTVTELSQNRDAPAVRGSEAMIQRVAAEAASVSSQVQPEAIVPARPVLRALQAFAGVAAVLVILFAANFSQASLLLKRFLLPGANLSLTQVTAAPADTWVPRREPLTLQATLQGRLPRQPATIFLRTEDGAEKTVTMMPKTDAPGVFQYVVDEVTDSFEYRVRAGDGQTRWHRITAVDRPRISEVSLKVTPPGYSGLPMEERNSLPHAIRILEGSEIEISMRSDQPLDRMHFDLGDGETVALTAGEGNRYYFRSVPTNSFTLTAAAINKFNLENKIKPSCHVTVYEDLAPSVKVIDPSDDLAVAPGEKVEVTFEATDDFGVAAAELVVSTRRANGATNQFTLPIDLAGEANSKEVRKTVELNLAPLSLQHGDQLSYVVQVTDTRQAVAQGRGDSNSANAAASPEDGKGEQQLADAKESESSADSGLPGEERSASEEAEAGSQPSSALAAKESGKDPGEPTDASAPPPNGMVKRMLDAGQCTACQPRNIKIDEWAGSFDGEKRRKLEIAIEPVLKQLDELLDAAGQEVGGLESRSAEGLKPTDRANLASGGANLDQAHAVVSELKSRTTGTPYAFIGLQLVNIDAAHVTPAKASLDRVIIPAEDNAASTEALGKAAFHIARAREMLADLTRSYESVKRDQQIADAMQRLSKMYQVFLEDSQALLGGGKPAINSYDRKTAEVDDAYVEKLKDLLEEKKKIMAELAKLLSQDPRLLRRYLATLQLEGTSYRDQLTLLAERQKRLKEQISAWNGASEADRADLLEALKKVYAEEHREVVHDATQLRENLETWLPLDVEPGRAEVQRVFNRAEKIIQMTARTGAEHPEAGEQALEELRALREELPLFNEIPSTNSARMATFIANRLTEIEALVTAQSGHLKIVQSLEAGDFPQVAEIAQYQITGDTFTLGEKLDATQQQVAEMSSEIAEKAAELNRVLQEEIITPQQSTGERLATREVAAAEEILNGVVPSFAKAEEIFDELMRLIIARLDEAPAPDAPGAGPDLETLLAMLQEEQKAAEGLGVPCRPINVSIERDWMRPGSNPGQGMARAQAQAAQAQAQRARERAQRLERAARESAEQANGEAEKALAAEPPRPAAPRSPAWNKLASRLSKDLLQGRDNTPPEQYRDAIESYFRRISTTTREVGK